VWGNIAGYSGPYHLVWSLDAGRPVEQPSVIAQRYR
jgi:hypothetical protein